MPTYEYKCKSCQDVFEVFQSMSSEKIKICPKCGGEVRRLIGAGSGPIFKGTGFYETDYKNKTSDHKKPQTKGTPPVKKDTESKPEVKSDSKPESKTESTKKSD
jgi:putative FmdB family regulatory protein